jgi:hypothetical protein
VTQHPVVLPHGSANLSVPAYLWPRQVKLKASREKYRLPSCVATAYSVTVTGACP